MPLGIVRAVDYVNPSGAPCRGERSDSLSNLEELVEHGSHSV